MKESIKNRIDAVRRGEVPEGYRTERAMLFPNEWGDPVALNTVLTENKDRNEDLHFGKEDVLSVSGEQGIINQIDLLGRSYAGESVAAYHIVETGDVVYTKSPLKENPYGIIKRNHGVPGIVSTLYAVYHCNSPITGQYLENYFSIDTCLNNYLKPLVKRGAKNDMKVNNEDVLLGRIPLPSLQEQERINEIIAQFDRVIELKQKLLEEVQRLKKMYLSKMFPAKGSCVPEIRFSGFTGDWEQRKAAEIAEYSKGNGYSKGDLAESGTPLILYGRLYTKYQFVINEIDTYAEMKEGAVLSKGNEVIIPASGETAEDIARASAVAKSGVLLGGDLNILRPFDFINPLFLALAISNGEPQKELAKKAQGKSVVHIHNSDIQEVRIAYPLKDEQGKIVAAFQSLDNLITLHQQELDCWQQKKKALMQLLLTGLVRVNA